MDLFFVKNQIYQWLCQLGNYQVQEQLRDLEVQSKENPTDLVTRIDREGEHWLSQKISSSYPDHSIWGEEEGLQKRTGDYTWIIDPLDGTMNYIHGLPVFGISVALQYREQTRLGVIHFPRLGKTFSAIAGAGAWENDSPIQVSSKTEPGQALLSVCIPYSRVKNKLGDNYLAPLHSRFRGLRIMGCVVFDLCQLARGSLDITLALKMKPWDVLAGLLIVEEAGGKYIQNKEGDDYSLLLSNTALQQHLQEDQFIQKLLKTR